MRRNSLIKEEKEKAKNSAPEIKQFNNTIALTLQGKKLYLTTSQYGIEIESKSFGEEETFEIKCSRDSLEYQLYNVFLDLMKELFGTKTLLEPSADVAFAFENKTITLASDLKREEYMDLIYDDENRKIIIRLRTKKGTHKFNNRLTFDYDCSLRGGIYPCFLNLFPRLFEIANKREQKEIRSRKI